MYLTVERGLRTGHRIPLERSLSIGSAEGADLRLEDQGIAPEHAVIKPLKGGGFGIKGLDGSVLVDGEAVAAARIAPGQRVRVGGVELSIHDGQPAAVDPAEPVEIVPDRVPSRPDPSGSTRGGDSMLGGYRLLDQLGKGGMGIVYRAEQVSLNREVALKVLSKELTEDAMFVGRFVAEARHAARMHHPNVVQVFDVDHEGDTYFYPMELMDESLERLVKRSGKLDPNRAVEVIRDAASGLAYAESLGLVHRDIKPDNIMLDRHGTAKLCDLGLAQTADDDNSGKIAGTPHFMAPEQILRQSIDHRTDLYALGCTFYRILTGATPFRGKSVKEIVRAQVKEEPVPPHKEDPDVPAELSPVVLKLLEKDPGDRYQSAQELVDALDALTAPAQRKWVVPVAAVLAVAAISTAVWFAFRDPVIVKETKVEIDDAARRETERLRAQQRESRAEIALLEIQKVDYAPEELATRYEELADDERYRDTEAGREAGELAEALRAEIARAAALAAQRDAAVLAAVETLRSAADTAIDEGRWNDALAVLALESVPPDLRPAEAITTARDQLRSRLQSRVTDAVQDRVKVVGTALEGTDAAALRRAAAELAALYSGEDAWPSELIGETSPLRSLVSRAESAASAIDDAAAREATAAAWTQFESATAAILAGPMRNLAFAQAASQWQQLADGLGDQPPAGRARALATAAQEAEIALAGIEARVDPEAEGTPQITLSDGTLAPVARLTRAGEGAGVVVLVGPRSRRKEIPVALGKLTFEQWRELLAPAQDATEGWRQSALLGWLALDRCCARGQAWLARIDPRDDDSGTAAQGIAFGAHEFDPILEHGQEHGSQEPPPWVEPFLAELRAARHLVAGMQAVSDRRNRAGHGLVKAVLENSPHAVAVIGLR